MLYLYWIFLFLKKFLDYGKIDVRIQISKRHKLIPHPQKVAVSTTQKMKFSIKDFFSKCDQIRRNCGLVTFTEKIFNGKL